MSPQDRERRRKTWSLCGNPDQGFCLRHAPRGFCLPRTASPSLALRAGLGARLSAASARFAAGTLFFHHIEMREDVSARTISRVYGVNSRPMSLEFDILNRQSRLDHLVCFPSCLNPNATISAGTNYRQLVEFALPYCARSFISIASCPISLDDEHILMPAEEPADSAFGGIHGSYLGRADLRFSRGIRGVPVGRNHSCAVPAKSGDPRPATWQASLIPALTGIKMVRVPPPPARNSLQHLSGSVDIPRQS